MAWHAVWISARDMSSRRRSAARAFRPVGLPRRTVPTPSFAPPMLTAYSAVAALAPSLGRHRPVHEGRLHRALKFVHRERLLQERLAGRELDAVRLNLVGVVRRHEEHLGPGTNHPKLLRELAATHQGRHHVRQQQIDRTRHARITKRHDWIQGADDRIAHSPQHVLNHAEDVAVIVDDENGLGYRWRRAAHYRAFRMRL